jgi:hypothetical protein
MTNPDYSAKVNPENLKNAYKSFVEAVAPEEDKILDWIGRSRNLGPRLFIRK